MGEDEMVKYSKHFHAPLKVTIIKRQLKYGIVSYDFTVVRKPQLQPEIANVHTITVYIQYKLQSILLPAVSAVK